MKKVLVLFVFVILFNPVALQAGNEWKKSIVQPAATVCYASDKLEKSFIPPPPEFLLKSVGAKKCDIIVSYSLFPANAKAAFEYAVSIWESIIESDVPIYVQANWRTIYDEDGNINTILGQAGPTDYYSDFKNAPHKNIFYPISVVEKITGEQISGASTPDISSTFNKEIKWYYGTDGKTPDLLYDFVTVVLHEIGHGLGFTGFFFATGQVGFYGNDNGGNVGDATSFDLMVLNKNRERLTDTMVYKIPSADLYNAFISNQLYTSSEAATFNNNGKSPSLYAPNIYSRGSSIYHLNDQSYPYNSGNALMTHAIGKAEAIHDPGPITRGILADVGWKEMILNLIKPKDLEAKEPIVFEISIESDYPLDTAALFVYYSSDNFKTKRDSIQLTPMQKTTWFSGILNPTIESGTISYYIQAKDKATRRFYVPSEAPSEKYSIIIGADKTKPTIQHTPIPYFVTNGEPLKIVTNADDNLGIDTVYVEYQINNIQQQPFGLKHDSSTLYSGIFPFDVQLLKDADVISYKIFAVDASAAKNSTMSPEKDFHSFKIEKIFNPIGGYFNDFNSATPDFIISDFSIYLAVNFKNKSLHSPHPYLSPNRNNDSLVFTTMLKYPIILKEGGTMSFDEVVLVEPGESGAKYGDDNFWDYVIVEGSKDNGKTWFALVSGYDSGANATWKTNYNSNMVDQTSKTVGTHEWYINREIKLLQNGKFNANDIILIRFRLFSDPYANGWGWTIDNLRIQTPVSNTGIHYPPEILQFIQTHLPTGLQ